MTEVEEEVRMAFAADVLRNALTAVFVDDPAYRWEPSTFARMGEFVAAHRRDCRRRLGIEVPLLVPVMIPRLRMVHLARADYPEGEVEKLAVLLTRWHPDLGFDELRDALGRAWPRHRADDIAERAWVFRLRRREREAATA